MELWKPVLGFEGFYEASQTGLVRSIRRQNSRNKKWMGGDIVLPIIGSRGYYVMNLTRPGVRLQVFLHKIILEAFVGKRPENMQACHNDGNRLNCRLDNLRWDTMSSNHNDKRLHGTLQIGEKNGRAKLTNEIVEFIRSEKLSTKQVMEKFGISKSHSKRIINKESWRHIGAE